MVMLGNQANDLVNEFLNHKSKSVYVPHDHEINTFVKDISNNNLNSKDNNLIKSLHNTDLMLSNNFIKPKDTSNKNNEISLSDR